jgi:putative phage-type endonuclease
MKAVQLVQGSDEWHEWRKKKLGGSDAPVIFGNSPYRTIRQLFCEKRGLPFAGDDEDKSFIFSQGHKTELLIRQQFKELTGVEMVPVCLEHQKIDYMTASLDGFDPKKLGVLEAKFVGQDVLAAARENSMIPDHHYTQMQHQLEVADVDDGHWFGHDGKKTGIVIPIRRDRQYVARLMEKEVAFWDRLQRGAMPDLSPDDYLIPQDDKLLADLRAAKEEASNAADYYEQLKAEVVATFKHPKIAGGGIKLFQVTRTGSISYKDIPEVQALSAEYLNTFRGKPSTSWSISVEKPKKDKS